MSRQHGLTHHVLRIAVGLGAAGTVWWVATVVREAEAASVRPDANHVRKVDAILSHGDAQEVALVRLGFIQVRAISLPHLYQVARSAARSVSESGDVDVVHLADIVTIFTASKVKGYSHDIAYTYLLPELPEHNPHILAWVLSVAMAEADDDAFYARCLRELPAMRLPADHEEVIARVFQACWDSRRDLLRE
ncbi:MAG: hypothetical protein KF859_10270 [Phycisphaeraceae bacterium]|nr:hypothetical protein [Phycisphaeraceae bacterium]